MRGNISFCTEGQLVKVETIEAIQGDVSPIIQAREKLAKSQQIHQEGEEDHV
jgi:hypothetical protein